MFSPHTLTVSSPAIPLHLGAPALEPVRLSGVEGVNSLFEYELLLKTPESWGLEATVMALVRRNSVPTPKPDYSCDLRPIAS